MHFSGNFISPFSSIMSHVFISAYFHTEPLHQWTRRHPSTFMVVKGMYVVIIWYWMIIGTISVGGFEFQNPTFPRIMLKTHVELRGIRLHVDLIGLLKIDYSWVALYLSILWILLPVQASKGVHCTRCVYGTMPMQMSRLFDYYVL
jgi:hypothetical protein